MSRGVISAGIAVLLTAVAFAIAAKLQLLGLELDPKTKYVEVFSLAGTIFVAFVVADLQASFASTIADVRAEKEILISLLREVVLKSGSALAAHQSDPSPLSLETLKALRSLSNHITLFNRCMEASSLTGLSSNTLTLRLIELRREITGVSPVAAATVSIRAEKLHLDLAEEAYRSIFQVNQCRSKGRLRG